MQNIVGQACRDHNSLSKTEKDKIPIIAVANWCSVPFHKNLINNGVYLNFSVAFDLKLYRYDLVEEYGRGGVSRSKEKLLSTLQIVNLMLHK